MFDVWTLVNPIKEVLSFIIQGTKYDFICLIRKLFKANCISLVHVFLFWWVMMPNCPNTTRKSNFSLVRSFLVLRLSLLTTSNAQYPRLYLDLMIEKLKITLKTTFQILSNTIKHFYTVYHHCIQKYFCLCFKNTLPCPCSVGFRKSLPLA